MLNVKFGLFDSEGKELNYEGYHRVENNNKTYVYFLDEEPQLMFYNLEFPPYKGPDVIVCFIGLFIQDQLVRKSLFGRNYYLGTGDTLTASYRLSMLFENIFV